MTHEPGLPGSNRQRWWKVVEQMLQESTADPGRCRTYWAQQLAYAPVLPHALALWLREHAPEPSQRAALQELISLARSGLAALPDAPELDPSALPRLAQRQVRALALGRRRVLARLAHRIGGQPGEPSMGFVPSAMLRPYPLLGWDPPQSRSGRDPREPAR